MSDGGDDGKNEGGDRGLQIKIALIGVAGAIVAAVIGAVISLHPWSSGSPKPSPGTLAIQTSVSSGYPALSGHVFVTYQDGANASAQVSGLVASAVSGEVARLYARQFPFTSPPTVLDSVALDPSGATAPYTFQVTPTLATRYTVKVFRNSTSTAPLATSATSTIYVIMDQPGSNTSRCAGSKCQAVEVVTVQVPTSALSTQMAEHVYPYFAINNNTVTLPTTLQLGAGSPVVSPPQQIASDEYQFSLTFSYSNDNESYEAKWRHCTKSMETKDGIGLPGGGSYGCGGQTIPDSSTYIG